MMHLLKSEIARFRNVGLVAAILHLLILRGVIAFGDLFAPSMANFGIGLVVYSSFGLLLGLYQWGSYKKLGRWTYLIHRPVAPKKIFAALASAAGLFLVCTIATPLWLITLYADLMRPDWVDARYYLSVPFVLGVSAAFYLVGTIMVLFPSRLALLVAVLPIFILNREAPGQWIFFFMAVVLIWLGYIAVSAFKSDLSKPLQRPAALIASAIPIQYSLFGALLLFGLMCYSSLVAFQEHGWKSYAAHSWNDYFAEQTVEHVGYRDGLEVLTHGLKRVEGERGAALLHQIELAERFEIDRSLRKPPTWGQSVLMDRSRRLVDQEHGVSWIFSHDRRLFHGTNLRTGASEGWLGLAGRIGWDEETTPAMEFPEIPTVIDQKYLVTVGSVYEFNAKRQRISKRFTISTPGERLASAPSPQGSVLTLLSTAGVYLFDAREWIRHRGEVAPLFFIELPGDLHNLSRINMAELIDGYLISFTFGSVSSRGFYPAEQVMAELQADSGHVEILQRIPLAQGQPQWLSFQGFIISPLMQTLHDVIRTCIGPYGEGVITWQQIVATPAPPSVLLAALGIALLAALLAFIAGRRRGFVSRRLWAWTLAVFVSGLPGLLSFFFLAPKRSATMPASEQESQRMGMGAWAGASTARGAR